MFCFVFPRNHVLHRNINVFILVISPECLCGVYAVSHFIQYVDCGKRIHSLWSYSHLLFCCAEWGNFEDVKIKTIIRIDCRLRWLKSELGNWTLEKPTKPCICYLKWVFKLLLITSSAWQRRGILNNINLFLMNVHLNIYGYNHDYRNRMVQQYFVVACVGIMPKQLGYLLKFGLMSSGK